jgi:hypothetical protein
VDDDNGTGGAPGNEHMNGGRAAAPPVKVEHRRKPAVKNF